MTFIPHFVKHSRLIQKTECEKYRQISMHKHTQHGNFIRLAFLSLVKQNRLETKSIVVVLEKRNAISLLVSILKFSYAYVHVEKTNEYSHLTIFIVAPCISYAK